MRAIVLLFPESRTSTSLNGESVVLASASSKGSKRIWSELGAFEMTFFILSINIASVGTVLYTYLLIEGEDEEKKTARSSSAQVWRGVAEQGRNLSNRTGLSESCRLIFS